ncbi:hypothetical protein KH5_13720 [Urechidicola sp. KH5]
MHKKLESELISLAHSILQMKNRDDVLALRDKAQKLYERLALLSYVDEFITTTPQNTKSKEELLDTVTVEIEAAEQVDEVVEKIESLDEVVEDIVEEVVTKVEEEIESVFVPEEKEETKDEVEEVFEKAEMVEPVPAIENVEEVKEKLVEETPPKKQLSLEEEFKDAVSVDVTADLFQKADEVLQAKPTLNDKFKNKHIQVDLNDRIAFVKHLFNQSQSDFNRVLSQLNSIETEKEAKQFINKMVKPDYDWEGKEEYEERFMALIERRF